MDKDNLKFKSENFKCPVCSKRLFEWNGIHNSNKPLVTIFCPKCDTTSTFNYRTGELVEKKKKKKTNS